MAITAADLVARVTADTAGAARNIMGFGGNLVSLGAQAGIAIFGLKELGGALASTVQGFLAPAAEMERYETQLGTLMGSTDAAKQRLAELAKFGAETPFELPELVKAEKVLQGFGLTGEKALTMTGRSGQDLFKILGDVAAGTGVAFDEIALNFGKFSAGATGEAISRFQELGIATREQMAALGIQFSKSGELLSPLPEAMQAVLQIAGSKFGGGMDALSNTFEGRLSTLQDAWGGLMRTLGTPLLGIAGPGLVALSNFLGGPVTEQAQKLGDVLATMGESLAPALRIGQDAIKTFQDALAGDWTANADSIFPLVNSIGILGTSIRDQVIPALSDLGTWLGDVFGGPAGDNASTFANDVIPMIGQAIQGVIEVAGPFAALLISSVRPAMEAIGGYITGTVIPAVQQVAEVLGPILTPMLANVGAAFDNLGSQMGPMMATLAPLGAELGNLGTALTPVLALLGGALVLGLVTSWEVISGLLMGIPTVVTGVVQGITAVVGGLADIIGGAVGIVTSLLAGDWAGAWNSAGDVVSGAWRIIEGITTAGVGLVLGIITGFTSAAINLIAQLVPGARDELMKFKTVFVETIQSIDVGAMVRQQMQNAIKGITDALPGIRDALAQLRGLFPSSPAKWGPWSELPEWESAFSSMPSALADAAFQLESVLGSMRQDVESTLAAVVAEGIDVSGSVSATSAGHNAAIAAAQGSQNEAKTNGRAGAAADSAPREPVYVSIPVQIEGNTFGLGPDGMLNTAFLDQFADILAPKVLNRLAGVLKDLAKA
jgi:phage-related protein